MISFTNTERKYFALGEIDPNWETLAFCSKINLWYARIMVFFDGSIIQRIITETKKVLSPDTISYENYTEFDTQLLTADRTTISPLTVHRKSKLLTAPNITAITPTGCSFSIVLQTGRDTELFLRNPRAYKEFPLGEWGRIAPIQTDEDFHAFTQYYPLVRRTTLTS